MKIAITADSVIDINEQIKNIQNENRNNKESFSKDILF